MGVSLRMRRLDPSVVAEGLAAVEHGFGATLDNTIYGAEASEGVLCDLAEEWRAVGTVLNGRYSGNGPVGDMPVMGGVLLGYVGDHPEAILMLPQDGVREAADFLRGVDIRAMIEANREELTRLNGGSLPDWVIRGIIDDTARLARMYGLAAAAGQVVAKRIYMD
ncbi:hypothetical protein [Streptomyces sp. SYSU K21746]